MDELGRLADVDERQVCVHLLDVAREPRDVHAACGELIGGESVVRDARAVDHSDGAGSELMRDGFEERGLAVSRGCE